MNWNEICTKYNSYWANNDVIGMNFLLNHVISLGYANSISGAFAQLQRRCGEYGWNINEWTHPSQANAQIDCYKCDEQIMNRIPASQSCPKSWLSSPVNPSTLQSANPCNPQARVTQNGGFNNGGGRVQAGIKRPDYYNAPTTDFNALGEDKSDFPQPTPTDPTPSVGKYNGWRNGQYYSMGTLVSRIHPIDIAGAKRVIGTRYWDSWAKGGRGMWKIDDGRPRGIDPNTGKAICTGSCTTETTRGGWLSPGGREKTESSCPCNRAKGPAGGCMCDGCADADEC